MRKIIFTLTMLCISVVGFSQNLESDFIAHMDSSGMYLQKASYNLTAGLLIGVAGVGTGLYLDSTLNRDLKDGDERSESGIYIAYAAGVISAICISIYIAQLNQSGKQLRKAKQVYQKQEKKSVSLAPASSGIGLALRF